MTIFPPDDTNGRAFVAGVPNHRHYGGRAGI